MGPFLFLSRPQTTVGKHLSECKAVEGNDELCQPKEVRVAGCGVGAIIEKALER